MFKVYDGSQRNGNKKSKVMKKNFFDDEITTESLLEETNWNIKEKCICQTLRPPNDGSEHLAVAPETNQYFLALLQLRKFELSGLL